MIQTYRRPQIDIDNVIEEVQSLGRQQGQDLRDRLAMLIGHLLKWKYQPEKRSRCTLPLSLPLSTCSD
ncbi:MAG: DUF29 family protein [Cyanobacteria bacterium P01_D01_bin.1]